MALMFKYQRLDMLHKQKLMILLEKMFAVNITEFFFKASGQFI